MTYFLGNHTIKRVLFLVSVIAFCPGCLYDPPPTDHLRVVPATNNRELTREPPGKGPFRGL